MKTSAIFDIGKTNKKFMLFDEDHLEVYKKYIQFDEQKDEDGFPCDDIDALKTWMNKSLSEAISNQNYDIRSLNFSAYGASFVYVGEDGEIIAPIFNYLKPYPENLLAKFYQKYGDPLHFATTTASPPLGMLNSGLQLYWLKYAKPELFKKIKWALHLPQYLSFLFTGIPVSDYTSIGCHTGLWDFEKKDYHDWVYTEKIDQILPPIVHTNTTVTTKLAQKTLRVGSGIHDSSAALLPYLLFNDEPFMVLSTGTWSICMNPFNQEALSAHELENDCLQFLSINGKKVKASRLFLGNEYNIWTRRLGEHFNQKIDKHTSISKDTTILKSLSQFPPSTFKWESIPSEHLAFTETDLSQFESYEIAYHKLMQELADMQIKSIRLAKGTTELSQIFIDGGFIDNELFLYFLSEASDYQIIQTERPLGSAIGAELAINYKFSVQSNQANTTSSYSP